AFRFGVQAYAADSADQWKELARSAEDLGFSCLSVADHYFGPGAAMTAASHPAQNLAAIPAMTMAAAVTDSILIGSRVMCIDYHQPVVLAKSLATIDLLSDGRLEAGLGAGWITSEYEAMGIPMDRAGVRIDRLIEYVGLIRAFFAGQDLDIDGAHVSVKDMAAIPAAVQDGGPKIMIGGGSPRVLRAAGALADIVSINFDNSAGKIGAHGLGSGTPAGTADKVGWIRDGAGDRFDDVELAIGAYFTTVTDDGAATREKMGAGFGMSGDDLAAYPHALVGSVDEICETLQQRRQDYGISYVTVGATAMKDFAPVVDRLTGT
ncbi:MAG: TIGR03621 family F420-dependent LLM class oxidoreductase, partial [Acidimicrobiales bacterium]